MPLPRPSLGSMAVREVVVWPDPRLTEPTKIVAEVTPEVRALYEDLRDTMFAEEGLSIAAVQIGVSTRMFLVEAELAGKTKEDPPLAFINPEVVWVSDEKQDSEEGCLSFPGIYIQVERPQKARVKAMDLEGKTFELEGEGLLARCLLHEYDHLTGKTMADFVGPLKKQMMKKKLAKRARDL